ncbi:MAG: hypothetical protein Q9164_003239 [Protoblastenia rupestris]
MPEYTTLKDDTFDHVKAVALDDSTIAEYEEVLARLSGRTSLQMDNYDGAELGALIEHLDIRKTNGNGRVELPVTFNLMS